MDCQRLDRRQFLETRFLDFMSPSENSKRGEHSITFYLKTLEMSRSFSYVKVKKMIPSGNSKRDLMNSSTVRKWKYQENLRDSHFDLMGRGVSLPSDLFSVCLVKYQFLDSHIIGLCDNNYCKHYLLSFFPKRTLTTKSANSTSSKLTLS